MSRRNSGDKVVWRVTGSGPHSLDSSYSLPGDCGDLRESLSFSEPLLARITKHPATAMCKLGRHMSQAQCLAYSQSSPNRSHLYCLVRSSLRHALRPTTGVVQIPGYSHNKAVTLIHRAELSGRNGHSPTPAVDPSTSFQETRAVQMLLPWIVTTVVSSRGTMRLARFPGHRVKNLGGKMGVPLSRSPCW